MKKRKIVMSVLIVTMLASCMACGKIHDHKGDTLKNSVTEKVTVSDTKDVEPIDVKVDDLKALADAGVITGVKDITVAEGTDVNLNDLVYADKNIVKSVDIDDSKVDYSKAGTYEVIYTITFDGDKFRDYVKNNNINVNFDTDGDTIVVKTTVTVTVATKEDADKAIASGNTDVVTPETKESVAESNKVKANDNAVASKPAEKPAGNTGNSNAGKNNSGNSSKPAESKPSGGNNSSTEKPHEHKWDTNYKTVTHEPVYEDRPVYKWVGYHKCKKCGFETSDGDEIMNHCADVCDSTYTTLKKQVQTDTKHVKVKDAWTEQVPDGQVCTICGIPKNSKN